MTFWVTWFQSLNRVVVLVKWRCGRYSTRSSMFCVKDVAGERYQTFQPGRRYTPISATGAKMGRGCRSMTVYEWTRIEQERHPSPSEAVIDKVWKVRRWWRTAWAMMRANRSKDGRLSVDTLGLVLRVLVTAASVGEREGGKQVLKRVEQMHKMCRLTTIWVDGGFDGVPFMQWVMDVCRWSCRLCCDRSKPRFVLLKNGGWSSAPSAGWWGVGDWSETMSCYQKQRRRLSTLLWSVLWWDDWHKLWLLKTFQTSSKSSFRRISRRLKEMNFHTLAAWYLTLGQKIVPPDFETRYPC